MIHVVLSLEVIDIFCEFIACMSPFKKCQHTTVTISISLLYKFCYVRINLDSPEVMVEMYQIIVGTRDKVFGPNRR